MQNMYKYVLGLYLYVLAQSWYVLELNLFEPVFQGMLVQEEFRRSKSLLFILGHGWEKTAFQRVFVCYCLTGLDSWHRQASKQSMQVLEATAFLCLHAIHKIANCLFHGSSIRPRLKKFSILLAGIFVTTLVNVRICRRMLDIWHQRVCITQCSTKSCKTGLSAVQPGMYRYTLCMYLYILVCIKYILVHPQYIQVHTGMYHIHTIVLV